MQLTRNTPLTYCLACLASLALTSAAAAQQPTDRPSYAFALSHGITYEEFHWSIAGNPIPDILSELHWRDMQIQKTQLRLDARQNGLLARMEFSYGHINSGRNQDSDYFENNRTDEFSRSYSDANGETIGINLALGLDIPLSTKKIPLPIHITPMLGFSLYEQKLGMHNGTKVVGHDGSNSIAVNQPLTGLDSSYDTNWQTYWLGGEISLQASNKIHVTAGYQYHFNIDYSATANWNLRSDFKHPVSYIHEADHGQGHQFSLMASYQANKSLDFTLHYVYLFLEATNGLDTTYMINNTQPTTKLNIAETQSHSFMLGLTWRPSLSR